MGTMNDAQTMQIIEGMVMGQAKAQEEQLDQQLKQMEEMTEDDFDSLREKRRLALIKQHEQKQVWKNMGHGEVTELRDQPDFFKAMNGKSENVIVLFYTDTNDYGKLFDKVFRELAPQHMETRFCKIDAEKAPYLCKSLMLVLMPTVLFVNKGKVTKKIEGLDELGGDRFSVDCLSGTLDSSRRLSAANPSQNHPLLMAMRSLSTWIDRKRQGALRAAHITTTASSQMRTGSNPVFTSARTLVLYVTNLHTP